MTYKSKSAFYNADFGNRLIHLMDVNGYDPYTKGADRRLSLAMHEKGIIVPTEGSDYVDTEELLNKSIDNNRKTIQHHRTLSSPDISCLWLDRYSKIFNCSADYLMGYIDAPTHENCSIQGTTGLSEDTAAVLYHYNEEIKAAAKTDSHRADNEKHIVDILNFLIGKNLNKEIPNVHYDTNGNLIGYGKHSEDYGILAYLHEYIMLGGAHHITGKSVIPEDNGKDVSVWADGAILFTADFHTSKESMSDLYRRTLKDKILSELDSLTEKYTAEQYDHK